MQNVIIKGKDNPARIDFTFTGDVTLASFSRLVVAVGGESYSTDLTPGALSVDGDSLVLSIGDSTELATGSYYPEIIGYSTQFNDGYLLSGSKLRVLDSSLIIK